MLQKLEIRNTLFGLRIWKQIFIFPKRWTLYSLNIKHNNFSLTLCSFDIYISIILPGEEAHLETIELFYYELPPYIDLKYSNQGKQNKKKIHKNKNKCNVPNHTHKKESKNRYWASMKTSICTDAGKYEFHILFDHIRWAYCFSFKVFSFFFQGLV